MLHRVESWSVSMACVRLYGLGLMLKWYVLRMSFASWLVIYFLYLCVSGLSIYLGVIVLWFCFGSSEFGVR